MHIVTRPGMLTLTVERLVGTSGGTSSGGGHDHSRVTMSPDSSDGSDTSSVSPTKSPHFTSHKISLLLSNTNPKNGFGTLSPLGDNDDDGGERTTPSVKVEEEQREVEGESQESGSGSKGEDAVVRRIDFVTRVMLKGEDPIDKSPPPPPASSVIIMRSDEVLDPGTSANHPPFRHHREDRGGDDVMGGLCEEERPPSAASGGSSGSTWSSTTAMTTILSQPNQVQQSHNSPKLKFSIHDILRPDFGQRAITKSYHHNHRRPSLRDAVHHFDRENNNRESSNNNGMIVRSENKKRSRPSSIRNHSEDSNSSCSSSRRDEVVDESKVNPEVPKGPLLWPAWVYCTRYSDRPSSGPRSRRVRKKSESSSPRSQEPSSDEKRPRTAFTAEQLGKLKHEFDENRYLTEKRRQDLARDLQLHENQIKIWFQNKRAKLKKSNGARGGLAEQLMAQGLYNHSTVPMDEDEDYLPC